MVLSLTCMVPRIIVELRALIMCTECYRASTHQMPTLLAGCRLVRQQQMQLFTRASMNRCLFHTRCLPFFSGLSWIFHSGLLIPALLFISLFLLLVRLAVWLGLLSCHRRSGNLKALTVPLWSIDSQLSAIFSL